VDEQLLRQEHHYCSFIVGPEKNLSRYSTFIEVTFLWNVKTHFMASPKTFVCPYSTAPVPSGRHQHGMARFILFGTLP